MTVFYQKKFLKDLANIPEVYRKRIEHFVFDEMITATRFSALGAEKMEGYKNYFKIRFGDYRVGLLFENNTITLQRVLHRKEIYRYFP